MKVFLSGATGVLGRRILQGYKDAGHTVLGLARSDENEAAIKEAGGTPKRADVFDTESLAEAGKGCDVFVHAATGLKGMKRITKKRLAVNDRVRRAGAVAMAEAAVHVGAKRIQLASVVWVARPDSGDAFDEEARYNPDATSASAMLAERQLQEMGEEHDLGVQILRLGHLYSADSDQTRRMGRLLAKGRMGVIGSGEPEWAVIHADDAARAFVDANKHGKDGLWHVVDEKPVASYDFLAAMAKRLDAEEPKRIPRIFGRLLVGKHGVRFFTRAVRTSNKKLKSDTSWKPKYPDYEQGLDAVVKEWKKEGFPGEA